MPVEVQDIVAQYGSAYIQSHDVSIAQKQVLNALRSCRTNELGAHVDVCDVCGFQKISYNSCRNRHCPKCQAFKKEKWLDAQKQYLLNIPYFHVVFTVPAELNPIILQNQETCYNILFRATAESLLELCADKRYLGAKPGITSILHTWGQNLLFHPHIHCVVTGGGLNGINRWVSSRKKFFLPVKVLSSKFRGKFLAILKSSPLHFYGSIDAYNEKETFIREVISPLYQKNWVVYCKRPFNGAEKVFDYLGRYTHRVAISNNRIIGISDDKVTFAWRDYADHNRNKFMTVSAQEFIRRFLLHVLPKGFRKIRHYGILAAREKSDRIRLCKKLTHSHHRNELLTTQELLIRIFGSDFDCCPCCGTGHLSRASPFIQ